MRRPSAKHHIPVSRLQRVPHPDDSVVAAARRNLVSPTSRWRAPEFYFESFFADRSQ